MRIFRNLTPEQRALLFPRKQRPQPSTVNLEVPWACGNWKGWAVTKSEARAKYKAERGKIPAGSVFVRLGKQKQAS